MIHKSKMEHDLYVSQTISNLAHDEAAFNIDTRNSFRDNQDIWGVLEEEIIETNQSMLIVNSIFKSFKECVIQNETEEVMAGIREKLRKEAIHLAEEAIQVAGIQIKADKQLKKANKQLPTT